MEKAQNHPAHADRNFMSAHDAPTTEPTLDGLSRREAQRVQALIATDLPGASELRAAIASYLTDIAREARRNEFLDLALARSVAAALEKLIDGSSTFELSHRRLVAAAVAYFVDADDAAHDMASPIGFEDDARVVNAVARAIGRDDVAIPLPN